MVVCSYEDRASDLIGLKLLSCSVRRHAPDVPVYLCCPNAPADFQRWAANRAGVRLDRAPPADFKGWNIKPELMLRLLREGHEQVIWMDSDLIVAGDFQELLPDRTSLVVTEEFSWHPRKDTRLRTAGWQLPSGRPVPFLINSAFLRATPAHIPLLEQWVRLMKSPAYRLAQEQPFAQRPVHLLSDQDVLTALLGATAFAHLPVHFLRRGREIIHDPQGGYRPTDRLANLFRRTPPLVHAQSGKVWRFPLPPSPTADPRRYYNFLHVETSPYGFYARQHRHELGEDAPFLDVRSRFGKLSWAMALGDPHLTGMPQSLIGVGMAYGDRASNLARRADRLMRRWLARGVAFARAAAASPEQPTI